MVVQASKSLIVDLKARLAQIERGRVRFCAHPNLDDPIHEMLIALSRAVYIRPHSHPGKSESFHAIEGEADVVIFNDQGDIDNVIRMGAYSSARVFYYRLRSPLFHTVVVRSDVFVVHETTHGPFRPEDTVFAPWAPEETTCSAVEAYVKNLDKKISRFAGDSTRGSHPLEK